MVDNSYKSKNKKTKRNTKKNKQRKRKIYSFRELPAHLQDNDCILHHYRAYYTVKECLKSVFDIHNETVNIWSHFLGSLFYAVLLFMTYYNLPAGAAAGDYVIMTVFLAAAAKCLLCSSIFHTLSPHKRHAYHLRFLYLDYCGISTLICGSFATYLHYGFYNKPFWQCFYYAVVALLELGGMLLPLFDFFSRVQFRVWRTLIYIGMGVVLFVLCCHAMWDVGIAKFVGMIGPANIAGELLIYLAGAFIYLVRYPERLIPGRVDLLCHSHQIWHVCILVASFFHYRGTNSIMFQRLNEAPLA